MNKHHFDSLEAAQDFYFEESCAGRYAVLYTVVPGVEWLVTIYN